MSDLLGTTIHITGIVQGVGFRPFVYGLAKTLALMGWVRNTSAGVDIEVDGHKASLNKFIQALKTQAPPLARIDEIQVKWRAAHQYSSFEIIHSEGSPTDFQPISPDVTVCDDCIHELFDPADRRFRYPFINCTNCGPRFTIIKDIPYDRPYTTMAAFGMCDQCAAEYNHPADRRFHAQPVACAACGPQIWIEIDGLKGEYAEAALQEARMRIFRGEILAIKGLGGFHLACDGTNAEVVAELRRRKLRVDKPFAVMMFDLDAVSQFCELNQDEAKLLMSRARPIVILQRLPECEIPEAVTPSQTTLGVMLPYTPLHALLLEPEPGYPASLVMTSGNLKEEPIAMENEAARQSLSSLADAFLMHDREIYTRCDDSVVRIFEKKVYPIRRSRGYSPFPVYLPWDVPPIVAVGGELKNTFCLTNGAYGFLSHHIGDMENYETLKAFEEGIAHFEGLFRVKPIALAYDLHPAYMATRYAIERAQKENLSSIGVQHHHAHIASCLAENRLTGEQPIIGISFDGTGYGDDGTIWGGEFLISDYDNYQRDSHLSYAPLPGGDAAIREPWRMALSWLQTIGVSWSDELYPIQHVKNTQDQPVRVLKVLQKQISLGLNAPSTSSMGRLFDAVSALIGLRQIVNYEAQGAIELEMLVDPEESQAYSFDLSLNKIDPTPVIKAIVKDLRENVTINKISTRFHNSVAIMVIERCLLIKQKTGLRTVALSGGVWQNMFLLRKTVGLLRENGFQVLVHEQVPTNDGGISLGQAVIAARQLRNL